MSELSPQARALLDSARDGDDPSARDRARMRQRLSLALAAASAGAAASAAAPAAATTAASASVAATATKAGLGAQVAAASVQATVASTLTAKIGVAVTVAMIGAAGSGVVLNREQAAEEHVRKPAAPAVEVPRAAPRKRARVDEPVVAAAVVPEPIVEPPPALAPAPMPRPVVRVERAAPKIAPASQAQAPEPARDAIPLSLQTEIQLLSSAQAALRDGAHNRALASLAEHASRFPKGALALERDAVRAIALCSSGRSVVGRSAALALAARIAGSPLAGRLERACELKGDGEEEP